jgi:hypothetical protein
LKRILADENAPRGLVVYLNGEHSVKYIVTESRARGWAELKNGDLLREAESAGFNILLTADKKMRSQQNFQGRSLAIIVLGVPEWYRIEAYVERVVSAIDTATPGSITEVEIPWKSK